jgi:hypothetical protein
MKFELETSSTGFRYISVMVSVDWRNASDEAQRILVLLGAEGVAPVADGDAVSVDTRWWNFTVGNGRFRIVYDEWPSGLAIEPGDDRSASLLSDLVRVLSGG